MNRNQGTVYVVATPIGNLEDITLRAIKILSIVDCIFAEDTRMTKRLLDKYNIQLKIFAHTDHNAEKTAEKILNLISQGQNVAVVSDAGTPGISDPGGLLIKVLRESEPFIKIIPIPGPSALSAFLSIFGVLPGTKILFLGFLPQKKGRETIFKQLAESEPENLIIFYESPHRILKTLASLKKFAPNKKVFIGREMTKIHEEYVQGTSEEMETYFKSNPDKIRGEFVLGIFS